MSPFRLVQIDLEYADGLLCWCRGGIGFSDIVDGRGGLYCFDRKGDNGGHGLPWVHWLTLV